MDKRNFCGNFNRLQSDTDKSTQSWGNEYSASAQGLSISMCWHRELAILLAPVSSLDFGHSRILSVWQDSKWQFMELKVFPSEKNLKNKSSYFYMWNKMSQLLSNNLDYAISFWSPETGQHNFTKERRLYQSPLNWSTSSSWKLYLF